MKKKMWVRILSVLVAVCMIISSTPAELSYAKQQQKQQQTNTQKQKQTIQTQAKTQKPTPTPQPTTIELNKTDTTIEEGESEKLSAIVNSKSAGNQGVTWSSDNKSIATVDTNGNVYGLREGEVNITVKSADGRRKAVCHIRIHKHKPVIVITLNKTSTQMVVGETETLVATVQSNNKKSVKLKWCSDHRSVAKVDHNGTIRGISAGTANITVTASGSKSKAVCTVTVLSLLEARKLEAHASLLEMYNECTAGADSSNDMLQYVDEIKAEGDSNIEAATDLPGVDAALAENISRLKTYISIEIGYRIYILNDLYYNYSESYIRYSEENFEKVTEVWMNALQGIDGLLNIMEIESIFIYARDLMYETLDDTRTTEEVREAAHEELQKKYDEYAALYDNLEYLQSITEIKNAGDLAVDEAIDSASIVVVFNDTLRKIDTATLNYIYSLMKENAKLNLSTHFNEKYYNWLCYTDENVTMLYTVVTDGEFAIDAANNEKEIKAALAKAIAALDAVPRLTEEEVRLEAHSRLQVAYDGYISTDYTAENWDILTGYKETCDAEIDDNLFYNEISVNLKAAIDQMAAVLHITTAEELAEAKEAAKVALYSDYSMYPQLYYTHENMLIYFDVINNGHLAINTATDLTGVQAALNATLAARDAIPIRSFEEFKEATYVYIQEEFDIFISGYGGPDYYDLYITIKEATDIDIDNATNFQEIQSAVNNWFFSMFDVFMESILPGLKIKAHSDLVLIYEGYLETNYTPENWAIIVKAKADGDLAIEESYNDYDLGLALDAASATMAAVPVKLMEETVVEETSLLQLILEDGIEK